MNGRIRLLVILVTVVVWTGLLGWHVQRERSISLASYQEWVQMEQTSPVHSGAKQTALSSPPPTITKVRDGQGAEQLLWFVQVSDLHINQYGNGQGYENFLLFLREALPTVDPLFVVATGDLTDGKQASGMASRQNEGEWELYRKALITHGILDRKDFWFDLRGNHDCFDVRNWQSPENYFATHSVMKKSNYSHLFQFPFGSYGLIAIDGCPQRGPSRLFNFFGTLDGQQMEWLAEQVDQMRAQQARHILLLGHYPIVTMRFAPSAITHQSIATISRHISALLSGHLHNMVAQVGRHIYAYHPTGFLDLEVGDLKENRIFRVMAIDHDLLSFIDVPLQSYPIILITNPKDARFSIPLHEPTDAMLRSTHIRVLIFSPHPILSAHLSIDGQALSSSTASSSSPLSQHPTLPKLWMVPWIPSNYAKGLHHLRVTAVDSAGNSKMVEMSFALDGTKAKIGTFGEAVARLPYALWLRRIYWFVYFAILLGMLLLPKIFATYKHHKGQLDLWMHHHSVRLHQSRLELGTRPLYQCPLASILWILHSTLFRLVEMTRHRYLFWPLLGFLLYAPIGPQLIGPIVTSDQSTLYFFLWGIWHAEHGWTFIFDTWTWCTVFLCSQVLPSICLLAIYSSHTILYHRKRRSLLPNGGGAVQTTEGGLERRHSSPDPSVRSISPLHTRWWFKLGVLLWWANEAVKTFIVGLTLGIGVLVKSPGFSWYFIFMSSALFYHMRMTKEEATNGQRSLLLPGALGNSNNKDI